MPFSDVPVLIVGAGPAGLAVAACLRREQVDFDLIDRRGVSGGAYRQMDPSTELLSPARYTQLPGMSIDATGEYISAGEYRYYLDRYASRHQLTPDSACVESIERFQTGFQVRFVANDKPHRYTIVVLATGIFDHPVLPTVFGLEPSQANLQIVHSRDWLLNQHINNPAAQRILIVGAGMSGVEIAEQCAANEMSVTVSTRHPVRLWRRRVLGIDVHHIAHLVSHRLPRWFAGTYCRKLPPLGAFDRGFRRYVQEGMIQQRTEVRQFIGNAAQYVDGSSESFDTVVLATGYRWHPACLPNEIETGDAGQPLADGGMSRTWPGLYFIGAPCSRILPSEFLHGVNHDAPRIAQAIRRRLKGARTSLACR